MARNRLTLPLQMKQNRKVFYLKVTYDEKVCIYYIGRLLAVIAGALDGAESR